MVRKSGLMVCLAVGLAMLGACGKEETGGVAASSTSTAPSKELGDLFKPTPTEATRQPQAAGTVIAPAARPAMESFLAALPTGDAVQWYAVGARGRSFVAKLTKPATGGGVAAEVYVTGLNGGVQPFRGQIPGGRGAPVVLVTPATEAAKSSQVLLLILTPSADDAERLTVSAVLDDRTITTLGPIDEARARSMIASILSQPTDLQRIQARAKALKAVDFAQHGFGGQRKAGDEVVLVLQGAVAGASVWGSGPYTGDSDPRRAAVHAGLVKDGEWGIVRAKFSAGRDAYEASSKNGVTTSAWKRFELSYDLERVD